MSQEKEEKTVLFCADDDDDDEASPTLSCVTDTEIFAARLMHVICNPTCGVDGNLTIHRIPHDSRDGGKTKATKETRLCGRLSADAFLRSCRTDYRVNLQRLDGGLLDVRPTCKRFPRLLKRRGHAAGRCIMFSIFEDGCRYEGSQYVMISSRKGSAKPDQVMDNVGRTRRG